MDHIWNDLVRSMKKRYDCFVVKANDSVITISRPNHDAWCTIMRDGDDPKITVIVKGVVSKVDMITFSNYI